MESYTQHVHSLVLSKPAYGENTALKQNSCPSSPRFRENVERFIMREAFSYRWLSTMPRQTPIQQLE